MRLLIKHEFKDGWVDILIANISIFSSFVLGGGLIRLVLSINTINPLIMSILVTLFTAFILGVFAGEIILIANVVKSMYTKFVGHEAYLTHMLPVSTDKLLLSKLIVNCIWIVGTILVTLLGVFILSLFVGGFKIFADFAAFVQTLFQHFDVFISVVFTTFIQIVLTLVTILFTLSLLNIGKFGKKKVLIGVLIYFGVGYGMKIVNIIPSLFSFGLTWDGTWVFQRSYFGAIEILGSVSYYQLYFALNIPQLLFNIGYIILFYFLSRYLLNRKLELE